MTETSTPPITPERVMETLTGYQRSAALAGAIELDLFTAIGETGSATAAALAERCQAAPRGVRILCDYLTIVGFLTKSGDRYALAPDSAAFLDRRSPSYLGGAARFLTSSIIADSFRDVAAVVRRGGTIAGDGTLGPDNAVWVEFARGMHPMMAAVAEALAAIVPVPEKRAVKVLDIAAGHGAFGIAFARRHASVEVVALDWRAVLAVAKENARGAGVESRFRTIEGSAFDVDLGRDYDLVLLPNFLHHFDPPTCERLLAKVRGALADGGRAVIVEFVPNDDRVTPPQSAAFSLVMLCSTASGDAYTYAELDRMCRAAGFARTELHAVPGSPEHAVIAHSR